MIRKDEFDIDKANLEIERKFLIEYPNIDALEKEKNYRKIHIEQTYIKNKENDVSGRLRKTMENGQVKYIYTYKKRISKMTRKEYETFIDKAQYDEMMNFIIKDTHTLTKDRHMFFYKGYTYEIDIYPFWSDKAVMEVELKYENEEFEIPPCIKIIDEVTYDKSYSNSSLATMDFTKQSTINRINYN